MSQAFPTHKQFIEGVRAEVRHDYPNEPFAAREDCVRLRTDEQTWLVHLGRLIAQGVKPELQVLDTLTPEQLYSLKKHYAPSESLDWYIPARFRTYRGLDPLSMVPVPGGDVFALYREENPPEEPLRLVISKKRELQDPGLVLCFTDLHFGSFTK